MARRMFRFGLMRFFRERRDAIEADVGQCRDGRAGGDGRQREGLRIVERPGDERRPKGW